MEEKFGTQLRLQKEQMETQQRLQKEQMDLLLISQKELTEGLNNLRGEFKSLKEIYEIKLRDGEIALSEAKSSKVINFFSK